MSRYSNISTISNPKDNKGARFYRTVYYPNVPLSQDDIYVLTEEKDRLDLLANQFYGDSSLWWVISICNPSLPQNSLLLEPGTQLRIPSNPGRVIDLYKEYND
jgi:hypothetical protein